VVTQSLCVTEHPGSNAIIGSKVSEELKMSQKPINVPNESKTERKTPSPKAGSKNTGTRRVCSQTMSNEVSINDVTHSMFDPSNIFLAYAFDGFSIFPFDVQLSAYFIIDLLFSIYTPFKILYSKTVVLNVLWYADR